MAHPGKTDAGLTYGLVAASAYAAYRNALDGVDTMGRRMPDYVNLDSEFQECMEDLSGFAEEQFEAWSGRSFQFAAEKCYDRFRVNMGMAIPFTGLSKKDRAAWEAVVRHLANILQIQPGEDLTSHEEHWLGFAEKHKDNIKDE